MNITHPFGISVFGSANIRVEPDVVSIAFAVSNIEKLPQNAFQKTRAAAQRVQACLTAFGLNDVGVSRLSLAQSYEYVQGKNQFVGYNASIDFNLLLRDLNQIEALLVDLVAAGVNWIQQVSYQTTRLKELRAQVRKQAVAAARQKAELYCAASGVQLGRILHIEDVNPNMLRVGEAHSAPKAVPEDSDEVGAFNPASVVVGGAVMMAFEIG